MPLWHTQKKPIDCHCLAKILMRKTTFFFFSPMNMLLLSSHLDSNWYFQRQHTGMSNGNACISALYGRDENKFFLVFSSIIKSNGLHLIQEDSKCCCSFFFMPGSYFLWKTLLISMLQLSTLDKRKGRKEANEGFMHVAQLHHRSPKELAWSPCGHQTAVILSHPFQFKVCETLPSATASHGSDPRSQIHTRILLTFKTKGF